MCSGRGQHRCYGGNDLACQHASVTECFLQGPDFFFLLHENEKLDFLKSEEGFKET